MKFFFFPISFLIMTIPTWAQAPNFTVKERFSRDNSLELLYHKDQPGTFTVKLQFDHLINLRGPSSQLFYVSRNTGILVKLKAEDPQQRVHYNYNYWGTMGRLKPKYDPAFIYMFPFAKGKKVIIGEVNFANEIFFGANRPEDWKMYAFFTSKPDTVTATRRGLVTRVVDKYEARASEDVRYSTDINIVLIEHSDGTLLRYSGFKRGSIVVKPGDEVMPGDPIGVPAGYDNDTYLIALSLFYLKSLDDKKGGTLTEPNLIYGMIDPLFVFDGGQTGHLEPEKEYTAYTGEELVTKEMNKRELKQYKKK